ncbi:TPA: protein YpfM [Escherichia coli]
MNNWKDFIEVMLRK